MKDEEYWAQTLVSPELRTKISEGTNIIRREAVEHKAHGRGPFGKLTQLGLLQMIDVGTKLREELCSDSDFDYQEDKHGNLYHSALFGPSKPFESKEVRVFCTDFPRTIQSVQGVLIGMFPDGLENEMDIDCRHTSWMLPDPQPRRSQEQVELEAELASRPHMLDREVKMRPLAVRCTDAVSHLLGDGAFDMAFGVGEENNSSDDGRQVLPWAQLAEITKCLKVRNLLPETVSSEDQEDLAAHCAWRWFESFHHPRLSYLAMNKFADTMLHSMRRHDTEPTLTIFSAHDSTLIALLCAFRLEMPSAWPEYGSYLKLELLEVTNADDAEGKDRKEHVVRFYLNGSILRSQWHGELREEISLDMLSHYVSTEGAVKSSE